MKNRTNKILELLTSEKRIEVSQLAEYLGVSQVTIRKDLDALEAKESSSVNMGMLCYVAQMISMVESRIIMKKRKK